MAYFASPLLDKLDILDKFWTMSKCPIVQIDQVVIFSGGELPTKFSDLALDNKSQAGVLANVVFCVSFLINSRVASCNWQAKEGYFA
jgi:hypothetical protein